MVKEAKEKGGTEKIKGERLGRPLPQVNPKLKGTTDIWSGLASKQDPLDVTCALAPGWRFFPDSWRHSTPRERLNLHQAQERILMRART